MGKVNPDAGEGYERGEDEGERGKWGKRKEREREREGGGGRNKIIVGIDTQITELMHKNFTATSIVLVC